MKNKTTILTGAIALASVACSQAAILYSSRGDDTTGFKRDGMADGTGIGVANTQVFSMNGRSVGDYFDASNYPNHDFDTNADASVAGTQEVWIAFLMRRDDNDAWAGGILLRDGTDVAGLAGWHSRTDMISLYNGNEAGAAPGGYFLVPDLDVAVLARYYENGTDGVFNRADLYIDSDLSDGVSFGAALISGYDASPGANAVISNLRLNADNGGEHRYYDNIVVSTTQQEAVNFVSGVPEPSSAALLGLGGLALILRRRK